MLKAFIILNGMGIQNNIALLSQTRVLLFVAFDALVFKRFEFTFSCIFHSLFLRKIQQTLFKANCFIAVKKNEKQLYNTRLLMLCMVTQR